MFALTLGTTAGALGADLALRTLPVVSSKVIDGILYFTTSGTYHPGFEEWILVLKKTDIEARTIRLRQLSQDLKNKEDSGHTFEPSVKMCINDINTVLTNLNDLIEKVKQMREYQASIYFGTWRFRLPDCTSEIEQLKYNSDLLKTRLDELNMTIAIMKNLS